MWDMKRRAVLVSVPLFASTAGCIGLEQLNSESSSSDERIDERGTMEITINGSEVDLTEDRFQAEYADEYAMEFHFHAFDEYWYMEGFERVSFAEAIDHIPYFEYTTEEGEPVITHESVYDARDSGTEIVFRANDERVDPTEYELQDGDHLEVEITTDDE